MNKINYKKFLPISILIGIFMLSGIVFSVGSNLPITQLPVSQSKDEGLVLNKTVIGNLDSPQKIARLTSSGWLGLGLPLSGGLTNPQNSLDVRGAIRLSELKQANKQVCANKDGDIIDCGFDEFYYGKNCVGSCNQAVTKHKFVVPPGVTSIQVELWGAGGMGYFEDASSFYNRSPDNFSTCLQGNYQYPDTYYCPSGGSSYFYDTNGSTILARAYGGKAPSASNTGGAGGTKDIPNNSKVTDITPSGLGTGSAGGVGENGLSAIVSNIVCGNTTYSIRDGKMGGNGGAGGSSGSKGATIIGPQGGFPGISANCSILSAPNNGFPFKGIDGIDGIRGSGGSGASGHGGSAYADLYNNTCYNNNCLDSLSGYSGGGGGGYAKIQVTVTPGTTYTLDLSHGGDFAYGYVPSVSGLVCDYVSKSSCGQNTKSGKGGDGFARISY